MGNRRLDKSGNLCWGELEEAETYLQEALQIARLLGYRERMSLALTNLGTAALEQGHIDQALERL